MAVRTERSEVRIKTTGDQYFPVRLEQARLVSSLLYGTGRKLVYLLKRTSGHLNSKGFCRDVFLMTRATQKEQAPYHEFENKFTERLHVIMLIIEKTLRTICSGI